MSCGGASKCKCYIKYEHAAATALGVSECKPVTKYGVEQEDRERGQSEAGGGGREGWGLPSPGGSPARGAWGSTWVTVFWCGATQSLSSGPGT